MLHTLSAAARRLAFKGLLIACLIAAAWPIASASAIDNATIAGRVTTGGAPVEGVWVYAYLQTDDGWDGAEGAVTDANGDYVIEGLGAGVYAIAFESTDDTAREYWNDAQELAEANTFALGAGEARMGIDADVARAVSISGRVTNAAGSAVPDLQVTAYTRDASGDERWADSSHTDANGDYSIGGLIAGTYVIGFGSTPDTASEYWNDKPDADSADVIVLSSTSRTGVNATVSRGASVSGRVTVAGGAPASGVEVSVVRKTSSSWEWVDTTTTNADGQYVISGLAAGQYTLEFTSPTVVEEYWDNQAVRESADFFTLGQGESRTAMNATVARAAQIRGRLVRADGTPVDGAWITAYRRNSSGEWEWDESAHTDSNGVYSIGGLRPGTYTIGFGRTNSSAGEYWNDKGTLSAATGFALAEGQSLTAMNATVPRGGSVSGRAVRTDGSPVSGLTVTVQRREVREDPNQACGTYTSWSGASGTTNANGEYTIGGLAPGTYTVQFGPGADTAGECWNDAVGLEVASLFTLADGQTRSLINATLAQGARISGRVVSAGGQPVSGVWVHAQGKVTVGGRIVWLSGMGSATDANGEYTVTGLRPGTYTLEFSDSETTAREFWRDKLTWSSADTFAVAAGETKSGMNATVTRTSRIGGRLTNATGGPAAGVWVSFHRLTTAGTWERLDYGDVSGADGRYSLDGIPSGTYRVEFGSTRDLLGEYWNNTRTLSAAQNIVLAEGQSNDAVNASLARRVRAGLTTPAAVGGTRKATVTGKLTPAHAGYVSIDVCRKSGSTFKYVKRVSVRATATGAYKAVIALPAGTYRFRAGHADTAHAWVMSANSRVAVVR